MIIARICDPGGKTLVQTGSIQIASYEDPNDGWFPVESFNFGFKAPGSSNGAAGKGPANAAPAKSNVSAAAPAAGSADKSSEKAELSITKLIDGVSCSLMMLVMTERSTKKGANTDKLWVDIHTISSVCFDNSSASERCIFTSTMVHLEAVNIQSWNLS